MLSLFAEIKEYVKHSLPVGGDHILHLREYGRADGIPVLFLHGGPGAGCEAFHARFFDPDVYRIILFDQRGCGLSAPHASLHANTTWDLVGDIEQIRRHLKIESWLVFGGSWGSTLALAYAQTHPERVLGLILRGIFLCRQKDIHWFYQEGASRVFPEFWRDFIAPIPVEERGDLLAAYHKRLFSKDEVARMAAAKAWSVWEGCSSNLRPNPAVVQHFSNPYVALSLARIECDYFMNDCYLKPNQLVKNAAKLKGIPGVIVHGRYDMVCPVDQAIELHQAWPEAELNIIADAGHSALETGIVDALVRATNQMAGRLK
ncbi:MAG: prolyl aminopeptidase [Gammaproteobacteria bacterium]|nr:prolyl aminopeptidase [Gammaproteobacteria bacterium]